MEIKNSKLILKTETPVFLLRDEDRIDRHAFFKFLDKLDRDYLLNFQKNFPIKKENSYPIVLPSGYKVLVMGVGSKLALNNRKVIITARRIISMARAEKLKNLAINFGDFIIRDNKEDQKLLAEVLAMQMEMANYEFVKYKTPKSDGWFFIQEINIFSEDGKILGDSLVRGKIVGEEINNTRTLSNTPGSDMTPQVLADEAMQVAERYSFKVEILEEKEMALLKMGGVLGVAKGSIEKPKFIVMSYLKGKRGEKPVVLIGKGVTFDTGGLNLKPDNSIYEMHMDMSGGSAVIHTIAAIARLKIKKNVIGLIPAVENMPSGSSYHPGDVLVTMNGKSIEVLNTDAEGRIILADALEYAKRFKPRLVIDVATLTGSAMSALGQRASAIFSTNSKLTQKFQDLGERVGDFVWPLPLWEEYEEDIKGTFGDVANIGKSRYGGAISAAVFLWQFIKSENEAPNIPWVHIDMAPRMTVTENEYLAKGAAGAPVGLLTEFLKKF